MRFISITVLSIMSLIFSAWAFADDNATPINDESGLATIKCDFTDGNWEIPAGGDVAVYTAVCRDGSNPVNWNVNITTQNTPYSVFNRNNGLMIGASDPYMMKSVLLSTDYFSSHRIVKVDILARKYDSKGILFPSITIGDDKYENSAYGMTTSFKNYSFDVDSQGDLTLRFGNISGGRNDNGVLIKSIEITYERNETGTLTVPYLNVEKIEDIGSITSTVAESGYLVSFARFQNRNPDYFVCIDELPDFKVKVEDQLLLRPGNYGSERLYGGCVYRPYLMAQEEMDGELQSVKGEVSKPLLLQPNMTIDSIDSDHELISLRISDNSTAEIKYQKINPSGTSDDGTDTILLNKGEGLMYWCESGDMVSPRVTYFYDATTVDVPVIEQTCRTDARYYTLDGTLVTNPKEGLYIRICGDRATKVFLTK